MDLCEKCQDVFDHWHLVAEAEYPDSYNVFYHHDSIFALAEAAFDTENIIKCPFCAQWYQSLKRDSKIDRLERETLVARQNGYKLPKLWVQPTPSNATDSPTDWELSLIIAFPRNPETAWKVCEEFDREKQHDWRHLNPYKWDHEIVSVEEQEDFPIDEFDAEWFHDPDSKLACVSALLHMFPTSKPTSHSIYGTVTDPDVDTSKQNYRQHQRANVFQVPKHSKYAMDQAHSWYSDCKSHPNCNNSTAILPSRLVSIKDKPRLCITSEKWPGQSTKQEDWPEYATVSHCWGSEKFQSLERGTLNEFKKEIPGAALSKTFTDAIKIAQDFNIQYIWIDSLCIIQNDKDDWLTQSSLMSSVYGGSALTIAATSAENGTKGCFVDRNPDTVFKQEILVKDSCTTPPRLYDVVMYDLHYVGLTLTPLNHRGWVVQERFLSPRVLHFSSSQLFWECNNMTACEVYPEGIPPQLGHDKFITKQPIDKHLWPQIVLNYTSCQLTNIDDTLVAISGLAHSINDDSQSYLAGLWRENLETQLCWRGLGNNYPEPKPYLGPSWSWAGHSNVSYYAVPEFYNIRNTRLYSRILTAKTTTITNSPFSIIDEAGINFLRLEGEVFFHGRARPDGNPETPSLHTSGFYNISINNSELQTFISWDFHPILDQDVYFLPICARPRHIFGLVLSRVLEKSKEQNPKYKRVGRFEPSGYVSYCQFLPELYKLGFESPDASCEVTDIRICEGIIRDFEAKAYEELPEKGEVDDLSDYESDDISRRPMMRTIIMKIVDII